MRWRTIKEALHAVFERMQPGKDYSWLDSSQIEMIEEGFRITLDPNGRYTFNGSNTRDFRIVDFKDKDLNKFIHEYILNEPVDAVRKGFTRYTFIQEYGTHGILGYLASGADIRDDTERYMITMPINSRPYIFAYGLFSNDVNGFQTFSMAYVPTTKVNLISNITGSNSSGSIKRLEPITPLDYIEEIPDGGVDAATNSSEDNTYTSNVVHEVESEDEE